MAATTSQYPSALTTFTIPDPVIARLYANIKRDLQPIFDTFGGSPGAAKISWGKGTPTMRHPPGSVYFRTDAVGTTITSIYVKQTATTSPVWSTFAAGDGTGAPVTSSPPAMSMLFNYITQQLVVGTTGTGWSSAPQFPNSWAGINPGYPAVYVTQPRSGSIAGLAISLMTNGSSGTTGVPLAPGATTSQTGLSGGTIWVAIYKNSVYLTGAAVTMTSGNQAYAAFAKDTYPFAVGDNIEIATGGQNAKVPLGVGYSFNCSVAAWVYYNAT